MKHFTWPQTVVLVMAAAFLGALLMSQDKPQPPASAPSSGAQPVVSTATVEPKSASVNPKPEYAKAAALRREDDGHFWALANVEGQFIKVMVDTGASTVALTAEDARKIGYDPDTLDYRYTIGTAGGEVMGAYIQLESIKIGDVRIENVDAMVLREGLKQSLLGMSFLKELYAMEFRGDTLILKQ